MAAKYLTMVGQLQWLVTFRRFDLHANIAAMIRFRAAPRQGHIDRLERIYACAISKLVELWVDFPPGNQSYLSTDSS